jgi:hypothetical protein
MFVSVHSMWNGNKILQAYNWSVQFTLCIPRQYKWVMFNQN